MINRVLDLLLDNSFFVASSFLTMLGARYLLELSSPIDDIHVCVYIVDNLVRRVWKYVRWYNAVEYRHVLRGNIILKGLGYA